MISYLKFFFVFLFELVRTNIVKMLLLTGSVLSFVFAGTFKDDVDSYNVAAVVKIDNNYVYVCKTISENSIKYENVWNEKEIPIKEGKIYVNSYAFLNGLMWFLFVIFSAILIIGTGIGYNDEDMGGS